VVRRPGLRAGPSPSQHDRAHPDTTRPPRSATPGTRARAGARRHRRRTACPRRVPGRIPQPDKRGLRARPAPVHHLVPGPLPGPVRRPARRHPVLRPGAGGQGPGPRDRHPAVITIAGSCKYAVDEELIDHSPAAHIRRPRVDYESHAVALDRNELGALLVAAGARPAGRASGPFCGRGRPGSWAAPASAPRTRAICVSYGITGRPAVQSSRRRRRSSPHRRTTAHFASSPTVTKVSQTRAPSTRPRTHGGACCFRSNDAASASRTTSRTAGQASEAFRLARRSARNAASSASGSQMPAASSPASATGSECCARARSSMAGYWPAIGSSS